MNNDHTALLLEFVN